MPYKQVYVNAEVFMTVKGIKVYHTYEDGELNERFENYFSFSPDEDQEGEMIFDVRELRTWKPTHPPFLSGADKTEENKKGWDKYHENNGMVKDQKRAIREAHSNGSGPFSETRIDLDATPMATTKRRNLSLAV